MGDEPASENHDTTDEDENDAADTEHESSEASEQPPPPPRCRRPTPRLWKKTTSTPTHRHPTPSPSPQSTAQPSPRALLASPQQLASSERTPFAVGSHHVDEEPAAAAPMIQNIADIFSFDIRQFLDEDEEEIISKDGSPPFEALKA